MRPDIPYGAMKSTFIIRRVAGTRQYTVRAYNSRDAVHVLADMLGLDASDAPVLINVSEYPSPNNASGAPIATYRYVPPTNKGVVELVEAPL